MRARVALIAVVSLVISLPQAASADGELVAQAQAQVLAQPMPRASLASEVIYFVLTDRYANGKPDNDRGSGISQGGFDPKSQFGFHGGDFVGMAQNLDRLKRLGVTSLWITPPVVQNAIQGSTSAYHGYWGVDFTSVDPHWGTEAEFKAFVDKAHSLGMRVFLDIVLNHTGDIIRYQDGYNFVPLASKPYRDGAGKVVDLTSVAGLPECITSSVAPCFPKLAMPSSFPKDAYIPIGYENIKKPLWLNDLTLYHNRGDANACNWAPGECAELGDFFGLDDIMTEHPRVIQGWADVLTSWIERFDIDGFRIDTAKHVDPRFFKNWLPKMLLQAKAAGKSDLPIFGEAWETTPETLATFMRDKDLPSVLDFGLLPALQAFSSGKRSGKSFLRVFARDDWYNAGERSDGVVRNAYSLTTFLGNHDMGRAGWLIAKDSQSKGSALTKRVQLGYSVLFLSRGAPVIYYGDEVGMIGNGGDAAARQDMFATGVSEWSKEARVGTSAIGSRSSLSKSAESLPMAKHLAALSQLRQKHPALVRGAFIPREAVDYTAAWSRIDVQDRREYVVVANSGTKPTTLKVSTSTPGTTFSSIFGGASSVKTNSVGVVTVKVPGLTTQVFRAGGTLPQPTTRPVFSVESYWDLLVGAPIVRVSSKTPTDPVTVTFAVRDCSTCTWRRIGSDDAPPFQMVIPSGAVDVTKPFQIAAIATTSDGAKTGGLILTTDPSEFIP
jgi:glycosidase